jgi:8-oxo-dGTP diphosphatase
MHDGRIAVVHRPEYDDWSLPKGKLDPGEDFEEAAVREVREETGLEPRVVRPLDDVHYIDRKGRTKVVRYWVMEADPADFEPNEEVDELRWVTPDEAADLLDYETDRRLVASMR